MLVHCRQMLALVQMPAGKPVRMSERWIERYGHLRGGRSSEEAASSRKYGGQVLVNAPASGLTGQGTFGTA